METLAITSIIHLKWRFKDDHSICVTDDKKVFNTKTFRFIKQTVNGGYSDGFWVKRKFVPTNRVNKLVELIPKDTCRF